MTYLVIEDCDEKKFISGETKKEIIIKALQKYLTTDWTDELMSILEDNFDLAFIDTTNIEEL